MKNKIIFFDWDGTLQSKEVSEQANVSRTKFYSKDLSEKEIIKLQHNQNNDHYAVVQDFIRERLSLVNISEIKIFQAVFFSYFYLNYVKENKDKVLLFDIIKLRELKKRYNLKFVIITSLYEATINASLRIHGIEDLFDGVYGCPVDLSSTKVDNLKEAISKVEGEPICMIGDRGEDIEAGKEFGLKTIYCNYGHGIDSCGADIVIEDSNKLIEAINGLVSNI